VDNVPCVTTILVADDNRVFAELLRATLEDEGYEVVTASTGLAAVAAVEQHEVSLAVLDVLMPGISGDAVAQRLRRIDPDLPVLLMSGSKDGLAAATGWPVLRKPFPQEALVEEVRRLVGESG
jgi:two-component system OmpR family response regulator